MWLHTICPLFPCGVHSPSPTETCYPKSFPERDTLLKKKKKIQWMVLYIINSTTLNLTFWNSFSFNMRFWDLFMTIRVVLMYFCWLIATISLKEHMMCLSILLLLVLQGDFCFYFKTCCDDIYLCTRVRICI